MTLLPALRGSGVDRADALRVAGRTLSSEALQGCANAVADRIRGARAVAVEAAPSIEAMVGMVQALQAGVPLVPVSGARILVSGDAPLAPAVNERIRLLTSHSLIQGYGTTETLIAVTGRADARGTPGTAGIALPACRPACSVGTVGRCPPTASPSAN
ncbi:AMP-binding protein [Micromonospora inyonensis]|uniref:AMP-binding enzyme n=1 Tax=Micromonospora inyonensis TaxID=47866 RepID=A0A1C6SFV3_9ACTN|nr:AMP-binding protein [Micromonospora inyonensis]SCL28317.1 AMP-binding enzyme [Micromonospora inyonensis]